VVFLSTSFRCAMLARQGGHHVAQNSIRSGWPVSVGLSPRNSRSEVSAFILTWADDFVSAGVAALDITVGPSATAPALVNVA
jgi:hypothetical protein